MISRDKAVKRLREAEIIFKNNDVLQEAVGIHHAVELIESEVEIPTVPAISMNVIEGIKICIQNMIDTETEYNSNNSRQSIMALEWCKRMIDRSVKESIGETN